MTHPTIHLSGDSLVLTFPPAGNETRTHEVNIPIDRCGIVSGWGGQPIASQRGWALLLDILRERQSASHTPTIAIPSAPNFYQVERALHAKKYDSRGKLISAGEPAKVSSEAVREAMRKVGLL